MRSNYKRRFFIGVLLLGGLGIIVINHSYFFLRKSPFLKLRNLSSPLSDAFLFHTRTGPEKCELANLDLNETSFREILERGKEKFRKPKCLPSSWKRFDVDYKSNLIRIEKSKTSSRNNVLCCYTPFQRKEGKSDGEIKKSKDCFIIKSKRMRLPPDSEFIIVKCIEQTKRNKTLIYSDLLGSVPLKPDVEKRILNYEKKIGPEEFKHKKVNIVIVGLDAVDKNNFLRYLPGTHNYIMRNLSGIEFKKYHRVAYNSFPNMLGFHMGMTKNETIKTCWPNTSVFLDECPFIWKEFARRGFRTSYAEDDINWSIFSYNSVKGFFKQPIDYDYRTLTRRMEKHSGYKYEPSKKVCYGDKFNHQVIIDNIVRTAVTLKTKPYFQFSWMTAMTHNVPFMMKYIGNSIIKMFQVLQKYGSMNNTVYILMADHGTNYGNPPKAIQGRLEANLPMFYMIIPKWFSSKYPRAMKNLRSNSGLLTTHFDSHETLKDFLDLSTITDESLIEREKNKSYFFNRGISFFLPIPKRRDCNDAGIMPKYCSCWTMQPVPKNHFLVNESMEFLAKYLKEKAKNQSCAEIITSGRIENSKCSIPNQNISSHVFQHDYKVLGVQPRCEIQLKILPSSKNVFLSLKKSNGTWKLAHIYLSGFRKGKDKACNLKLRKHNSCDCLFSNKGAISQLGLSQLLQRIVGALLITLITF